MIIKNWPTPIFRESCAEAEDVLGRVTIRASLGHATILVTLPVGPSRAFLGHISSRFALGHVTIRAVLCHDAIRAALVELGQLFTIWG